MRKDKYTANWSIACQWVCAALWIDWNFGWKQFCVGFRIRIGVRRGFRRAFPSERNAQAIFGYCVSVHWLYWIFTRPLLLAIGVSGYQAFEIKICVPRAHKIKTAAQTVMFYSFDGNDINFGISANAHSSATKSRTEQRQQREMRIRACRYARLIYPSIPM